MAALFFVIPILMICYITYALAYLSDKPANWYHFWLPQSGAIGGMILFFVCVGSTILVDAALLGVF